MAEMAFAEGETAKVRKYAKMAKERAFCDGPPYCYKKTLDEAEEKLKGKSEKGKVMRGATTWGRPYIFSGSLRYK